MSELLPCPFCGGEAETRTSTWNDKNYKWTVQCKTNGCMGEMGCAFYRTEAEAIEAWNTRADDYRQAAEYWQRMYEEAFAERTCHDRNASAREHGAHLFMWRCSNCGESYDTEMNKPNYCPYCGAKVVNE